MSVDEATDLVKQQTPTRDAFLGGRLTLSQPRNGFRAGLDSVLLGAAVPAGTGRLLDMGAGVGTADGAGWIGRAGEGAQTPPVPGTGNAPVARRVISP